MVRTALMWTALAACLFAVGPGLVWLSPRLTGGDGGPGWTYLANDTRTAGVVTLFVIVGVATVCGVLTGRFFGLRAGLGAVGMALAAPAFSGGTIVEVLRWADAPGVFLSLALEGLLFAALGVAGTAAIARVTPRHDPMSPAERIERSRAHAVDGLIGAAAALSVGAVAAWVIAREPIKGQMLASGVAAGVAGMAMGRVVAPRAPVATVAAGVLLLGVLGPALGFVVAGGDALRAAYEQRLPAIAGLMPIDWFVGAMIGMPLGLSWSLSVLEKRAERRGEASPA